MSFFREQERILKNYVGMGEEACRFYYGLDCKLLRLDSSADADVYGPIAGGSMSFLRNFKAILLSDDFFPADNVFAGKFEEGWLLLPDNKDIIAGDVVVVDSDDGKMRRYKVIVRESIGSQTEIISKWKLSNMAD